MNRLLRRHSRAVFAGASFAVACATPSSAPGVREATRAPHAGQSGEAAVVSAPASPSPVHLVVSIVIDQLPSWALDRYLAVLSENGLLRQGIADGAFFPMSRYAAATTLTAPGHATIYTGAAPNRHGVLANDIWSREAGKAISVVDDRQHRVFGQNGAFASPRVLRADTVADELERVTGGRARTISLSFKDRSAVLPGGQRPDLALWFDWRKPGFTTSEYYSSEPPAWLVEWEDRHPPSARLDLWSPRDVAVLERLLGADSADGEGDWLMLGRAFPHDARRAREPFSAFRATPGSTAYLLDLARECVHRFELGRRDVPDLLMLSVSGTDYVGHVFGAESWEYLDNLMRVDEMLGAFVAELAAAVPLRVLVTSDHGVAPLPEKARALGRPAERVKPDALRAQLDRALRARKTLGTEPWVESFAQPFVHLTPRGRAEDKRGPVVRALIEELEKLPFVASAFDVRELVARSAERSVPGPAPRTAADDLRESVALGIPPDANGDVYVLLKENSIFDAGMPPGAGANHGSPWAYDAFVPVVFFGTGLKARRGEGAVEQSRVAATLARLLEIAPPKDADPRPLPGVEDIVVRYR